ncbi:MAG: phage tail protein [Planctomycetaceae bacterium]|nr:phage tail protein [Planctomycetaceae bacterium]
MSEPFVGEIRMFAGNFAPRGWAFCDGQLLAVSQNDALFSLLGTIYGGDGRNTFALPDLRGRVPVHIGTGPGLSQVREGAKAGSENVTLIANQIPTHSHPAQGFTAAGTEPNVANGRPAQVAGGMYLASPNPASLKTLAPATITEMGGSQSHTNMQPFLCVYFIIALVGIYPSRT